MSKAGERNGSSALVEAIDRILPQTQCTRCGYAACKPYAEAMAAGEANINRCPPGGQAGIVKLARLLGREARPLDPDCGVEKPLDVAVIDEPNCIGCTLCIKACPVDAIVGAPKLMHTVIRDLCTGCELCLPPCPVDCILMVQPPVPVEWTPERADAARRRFESRKARLEREHAERTERLAQRAAAARAAPDAAAKRAIIEAAMQRARAARSGNEKQPAVEEGCSPDGRKA